MKLSKGLFLALALPVLFYGCDSRTVNTSGIDNGTGVIPVDRVVVSLSNSAIYYSQNTLNTVVDTVTVRVLGAGNASVSGAAVSLNLSTSFGSLTPIGDSNSGYTANTSNADGVAKYVFRLLPDDQTVPLPPGYIHILSDAMSDAPIPVDLETPYVAEVAWADHRFAKAAIDAWDGKGTLVIVVDRMHVEGGLGVGWQAQRLTGSPVVQAMLANGESRCYAGDQLLP